MSCISQAWGWPVLNVSGDRYVVAAHTQWFGANCCYQAACEQGHCALTGNRATSKHEGQIFTLLD